MLVTIGFGTIGTMEKNMETTNHLVDWIYIYILRLYWDYGKENETYFTIMGYMVLVVAMVVAAIAVVVVLVVSGHGGRGDRGGRGAHCAHGARGGHGICG